MALLPGSIGIDAAIDCTDVGGQPVTIDQRGVSRPQGPACDVGAYERAVEPPPLPPTPGRRAIFPRPPLFVSEGVCGCQRIRRR